MHWKKTYFYFLNTFWSKIKNISASVFHQKWWKVGFLKQILMFLCFFMVWGRVSRHNSQIIQFRTCELPLQWMFSREKNHVIYIVFDIYLLHFQFCYFFQENSVEAISRRTYSSIVSQNGSFGALFIILFATKSILALENCKIKLKYVCAET